ncbi:APC family permease [Halosolutus amylolyticus]|uniref:APC family permease n=1 Tax=Halosolutus amylolyticus TaxID=2932267 RepID=A0ABD5PR04_9EURY|nr:APC family permease [Halosolutus amylolyticus]
MSEQTGEVTLVQAVAIEVGLIVGGALFSLTGVAVGIAGPGVVVAFVLAFSIAILGLVPTAMLGAAFPTTGGNYRYPARFVSRPIAFLAAWGLGVSMFGGGLPLYALTAGQYVDAIVPVAPTLVGVLLLSGFFVVNLVGIRPAATVQLVMFVGLIAALGSFVVLGVPAVETANLTPAFPSGAIGVATAAGVLYFVCLGANFVVDIGGSVRDATVTIPRSFAITVPLVLAVYVGIGLVAVGVAGTDALAGETLAVPAGMFLPGPLQSVFVVGGALFAIATSINAVYIITPRYLAVLAEDGLVPSGLARTNSRFDTPHWGLVVVYALSTAALLSPLPIAGLGSLLGFGGAFLVVPVMAAAIVVGRTRAETAESAIGLPAQSVTAMAALAIPCNLALLGLLAVQSPSVFALWAGLLAAGGLYYVFRTRIRTRAADSVHETPNS